MKVYVKVQHTMVLLCPIKYHDNSHKLLYRTNIFCDKFDSSQKTYCKRLRVLCPEHTKEPKVGVVLWGAITWLQLSTTSV